MIVDQEELIPSGGGIVPRFGTGEDYRAVFDVGGLNPERNREGLLAGKVASLGFYSIVAGELDCLTNHSRNRPVGPIGVLLLKVQMEVWFAVLFCLVWSGSVLCSRQQCLFSLSNILQHLG